MKSFQPGMFSYITAVTWEILALGSQEKVRYSVQMIDN